MFRDTAWPSADSAGAVNDTENKKGDVTGPC